MAEKYQALYRKWRPLVFEDVAGQDHVSETLRNSITNGRIAHAYLFCGTRGTGKTSTAKIFSRAVNCEHTNDGNPCNNCDTCRGIMDGSILDVYEMDAASNSGIDNIREIREEVIYTPTNSRFKVYIIDEAHMLTTEAFNALLKTLEEPPEHIIFILATTEPHKIPATILSRCQRFDFRRIGIEDIERRLSKIVKAEGISITPDALELVAELADGSMRDGLSILDQCAAFAKEELRYDDIVDIVGIADKRILFPIVDAIAEYDASAALFAADSFLKKGKETADFLEEMIFHFRALMLCKSMENPAEILEKSDEVISKYKAQADKFNLDRLIYIIQILGDYLLQAKKLSTPKVDVEILQNLLCGLKILKKN
ncbi:MAG: DNA polymerase III subunit gamma/tau [bacterium]|nr:DNA polymerase III subunit gamma/tau [bacterium]